MLSLLLLSETSVYALQRQKSSQIPGPDDNKCASLIGSRDVSLSYGSVCKGLIDCDDPGQTGRNFCRNGWAKSACEFACENKAKDKCWWSPNSVRQCKAQCTVRNGCTNN